MSLKTFKRLLRRKNLGPPSRVITDKEIYLWRLDKGGYTMSEAEMKEFRDNF